MARPDLKRALTRLRQDRDRQLPQARSSVSNFDSQAIRNILLRSVATFLVTFFLLNLLQSFGQAFTKSFLSFSSGSNNFSIFSVVAQALNPTTFSANTLLIAIIVSVGLTFYFNPKVNKTARPVAYGQKGDSRFATLDELKKQYPSVPDKQEQYEGCGGVPISHYRKWFKGYYLIDPSTSHTIINGTSRSGKSQSYVLPQIDLVSRADKKASMIINDPKGELYANSAQTLRKRGYRVLLLNMEDPDKSMGYNPLSVIIEMWKRGDIDRAMQLLNTLTYTLFHTQKGGNGQNEWVYADAQAAVNGMVIALLDFTMDPSNFDDHKTHPEKVTFTNVLDMVSTLGQEQVYFKVGSSIKATNKLDEYFSKLPENSFAKHEYSATNLSAANGKGSIMSTIMTQLEMFATPKNAKMTSSNSLDLRSVGFPKYLSFKLPGSFRDQIISLNFYHAKDKAGIAINKRDKSISSKPSATFKVRTSAAGFVDYNYDTEISENDVLAISYKDSHGHVQQSNFILAPSKNADNDLVKFKQFKNELPLSNLEIHYSSRPTTVFLKIPDSDNSNNALASIFISQLYSELAKQCSLVPGGKVQTRVHFILDEFGNMVPVKDMGHFMTVSASREILFTLIIQSYQQLYGIYGKEVGATIKENGQNLVLVATTDRGTLREFSEAAGNYTAENQNISSNSKSANQNYNLSAEKLPLISTERLSQLYVGESLVIRGLYRKDLNFNNFRPFPIFNTGKTEMPYAHELLSDVFNFNADPTILMPNSDHASLKLKDLAIDWEKFYEAGVKDASQGSIPQNELAEEPDTKEADLDQVLTQTQFFNAINDLLQGGYITTQYAQKLLEAFQKAIFESNSIEVQRLLSVEEKGVIITDEQRQNLRNILQADMQDLKAK